MYTHTDHASRLKSSVPVLVKKVGPDLRRNKWSLEQSGRPTRAPARRYREGAGLVSVKATPGAHRALGCPSKLAAPCAMSRFSTDFGPRRRRTRAERSHLQTDLSVPRRR